MAQHASGRPDRSAVVRSMIRVLSDEPK